MNKAEELNKKEISFWKIIKVSMPFLIKQYPLYGIIFITLSTIHGLSFGVNTFMTQKFFDSVSNNIGLVDGFNKVIIAAILLGLALIISQILNGVCNFMGEDFMQRNVGRIGKVLNKKANRIDPINFENPIFLDDINKAELGAKNSVFTCCILILVFSIYIPYFIFMGVYLYKLKPILGLIILIIFIPIFLNQVLRVKLFADLEDKSAPIRRQYEYYEKCIIDKEYYKETRLLGAFSYFKNIYEHALKLLNKNIWKTEKKATLIELMMNIFTMIGDMIVLYLLVIAVIEGDISIGAFGAVISSIGMIFSMMEELITRHIGNITRDLGTVKNFVRFLEIPERHGMDLEIEGIPEIKIENAIFAYPGADKEAIKNLNLKINSGETVAIVGENGSGKTTLVKLLTGLYIPTEGKVTIGNIDTSKASIRSIYKSMSGVFQKYQRYKVTLKENVSISKFTDISKGNIENRVKEAIEKADLEITEDKFPKGYDTMLSREFDGVDLSGGQWQRIAIARGFYPMHNMIVLDEPTAAIDPVEETKIYKKFQEISRGKTSIIVTHRLGSAKIANRIVVMDKGQIVEIGNHEELMKNNGKYAEMYEAQSKWYESITINS